MLEQRDSRDVTDAVRDGNTFTLWAPGDATVYRVAALRAVAYDARYSFDRDADLVALVVLLGGSGPGPALVVTAPTSEVTLWTPQNFLNSYGRDFVGWWPGVRPLLAALSWTDAAHGSLAYESSDVDELSDLLDAVDLR